MLLDTVGGGVLLSGVAMQNSVLKEI